jgi:hypothetical protein
MHGALTMKNGVPIDYAYSRHFDTFRGITESSREAAL